MVQSSSISDSLRKTTIIIKEPDFNNWFEIAKYIREVKNYDKNKKKDLWEKTFNLYKLCCAAGEEETRRIVWGKYELAFDLAHDEDFRAVAGISYSDIENSFQDIRMGIVKYYFNRLIQFDSSK